jgi:uncharacterized protein (DUF362 family)
MKTLAVAGGTLALGPLPSLGQADKILAGTQKPLDLCIARWGDPNLEAGVIAQAAAKLTQQAISALGGMSRFVGQGDVVWIKPNIGWNKAPELAATTNPDVVATLVRLCFDAGAKTVKVGDNPCNDPKKCYQNTGIAAAATAAGAQMVFLDEKRFKKVSLAGQRLIMWDLYPEILEADLVINVPIAKHHGASTVTFCMKNYMGVIGGQRSAWHQDIPACLVDITRFMKPRLCVLDAVRTLTRHGPQGGDPADVAILGTVAAGTDIVALDALGCELMGHKPADIGTVKAAHDAGLGRMDFREALAVAELQVS